MRDIKSSIWIAAEIIEKKRRICSCYGGCGVVASAKGSNKAITVKGRLSHQ